MQYLNIHTHHPAKLENVTSILSLSIGHDDLTLMEGHSVAIGLHPWLINTATVDDDVLKLAELAEHPNIKMIGECGLDKLKGPPLEKQLEVFETQLLLAKKLNKPLILHIVKAYDELIALRKKLMLDFPMVIHGFNKSEQLGKQLVAQGFSLSFGKVLFDESSGAANLVKATDDFFLETDDSEVSIEQIYKAAAKLKKLSVDDMKALIFANWKKLNLI